MRIDEPALFHSIEGPQHPESCAMPSSSTSDARRRLGESMIAREKAAKACAHVASSDIDDCISDVIATGDEDMAGTYDVELID